MASFPDRPTSMVNVLHPQKERMVGIICALAVIALFSGFTLISRSGLSKGALGFSDLAALRFGIGGLLLSPVLLRYGFSGLNWRQSFSVAFLGGLGFALCAYAGFSLTPAAHGAVLLHGTLPLFTFLIVAATTKTAGSGRRNAGVGLIAVGILAIAWDSVAQASPVQLLGDGFLLAASLCWSAYGVTIGRFDIAPIRAAAIVTVLSATCFLPAYAIASGDALLAIGWRELVLQSLFQGVAIGAVSIFVYTKAVAGLGASQTSLFTAAVPCVTTLGAIPLLHEWPTPLTWIGVIVVTIGTGVALRGSWAKSLKVHFDVRSR